MQNAPSEFDRNIRIGLVGPLPPPFGGMANQTEQLARFLAAEGIFVDVVQTNASYANGLIARIKGLRALVRLIPYVFRLWKLARRVDCLHVMANSGWSWQLFAAPAIWIGWLRRVPVIVNYRGGDAKQYFRRSSKWIVPTLNKATAIIVPSGFLKDIFNQFGFSVRVIPNIIDFKRFVFKGRTSVQNKQHPRLVVSRNLEAIYGIDTAIKTISLLHNSIPGIRLFIAGSGPLLDELVGQVQSLGLSEHIEFTGKLTPDEMEKLYASVDIMLNPTNVDNMPNSVLEALANGIPVVTTNVGGIPYLVTDDVTALMVDANCPEMMANKVMQLINDDDLYERLVFNGARYVEKYDWNIVKYQWINLYLEVAAAHL